MTIITKSYLAQASVVVSLLSCCLLLLGGCRQKNETSQHDASASPVVNYPEFTNAISLMTHLAYEKGYLKDQDLDFRPLAVQAGPDVVSSLRGSSSNAGLAGNLAITPVVTMIGAGESPVIIATMLTSWTEVKLATFSKQGITHDPKTLEGKKIGLVKTTIGEAYFKRLLESGGLTESSVISVNARPVDLRSMLLRGDLDAALLWDPYLTQIKRMYPEEVTAGKVTDRGDLKIFVDPSLYLTSIHVVTTRSKLEERREDLIRVLRGLVQADTFIKENPKKAQGEVESWLGLSSGDLDDFFASCTFTLDLDVPVVVSSLRAELDDLKVVSSSTLVPDDLARFVDASLLKSIAAARVKE